MKMHAHHKRVWKFLYFILKPWICHKFNIECEEIKVDGPIVLIVNHTNTWDPLILARALKHKQVYFVASEHIFRLGFISKVINWLVGPIARKKGASGKETTEKCLKHLHEGHSICIFGEGEQSWDGLSKSVIRGTGKLVKDSGATLVNYRLIGGYMSLPRWADNVRKGKIIGEVAGIYSPEQLKDKSPEEINEIMNKDIFVDMWDFEEKNKIKYMGKNRAEHLERMLYLCPKCLNINTLKSSGDYLNCSCGFNVLFNEYGFLEPSEPFKNLAQWEKWQKDKIRNLEFNRISEDILFKEEGASLKEILPDHTSNDLEEGELVLTINSLSCGKYNFDLKDISKMAMTRYGVLLFTHKDTYYQIRLEGEVNLRKYLEIWKKINNKE